MNPRLLFALCVAIFGLFATQALADDYCLGIPFKQKDLNCGVVPCPYGTTCDKTGMCSAPLEAGSTCTRNEECKSGMCNGPNHGKICVVASGPGQPCTGDPLIPKPDCAPPLSCNTTSLLCTRGMYGDGCSSNDDCLSQVCTNGACDGPTGLICAGDLICSPSNYCFVSDPQFPFSIGQCTPRLATGSNCTRSSDCASGLCLGKSMNDPVSVCVAKASVAAGEYCTASAACASGLCGDQNTCLGQPPSFCTGNDECLPGQFCVCGKDYFTSGHGKCVDNDCAKKIQDIITCLEGCKIPTISYPNSCFIKKCQAQLDALAACNDRVASIFIETLLSF